MKVLLCGNSANMMKIEKALLDKGIEAIAVADCHQYEGIPAADTMVIIDSACKEAELAYAYFKKALGYPVAVIVSREDTEWRKLSTMAWDGFINPSSGAHEAVARIEAILRRIEQTSPINQGIAG